MPPSTIFQLYRDGQFYWWRKPSQYFSYIVAVSFIGGGNQQYFSYIVAISFIGGGNRSTQRKPPTCH